MIRLLAFIASKIEKIKNRTFAMGHLPSTNLDKALELAARLEDEETVRKQAEQK